MLFITKTYSEWLRCCGCSTPFKKVARHLSIGLSLLAICIQSAAAQVDTSISQRKVVMPDNSKITLLIQLHVAALCLANITGNYTVLHSLGSPNFQSENPPAQLANAFSKFRVQGIDICPAILLPPELYRAPRLEGENLLRVSGEYSTKPQRVVFQMVFQAVNDAWRLAQISVKTT